MDVEGRWLTYGEIAAIRGTKRASAIKLAQREKWPRQAGNDRSGTVKVLVPGEWLVSARDQPAEAQDDAGGMPRGFTAMLDAANRRADEANKRADVALSLVADANARTAEVRSELEAARAQVQAARDDAEALRRAEASRKARGLLARLRAALRGE